MKVVLNSRAEWKRLGVRACFAALVPAIAISACALIAGWQLNSQQEFHGADHSSFITWLTMGMTWFTLVFAVAAPLFFGFAMVLARRNKETAL
jgi:hypothetical protein